MKLLNDILNVAVYEYKSILRSLPVLLVLGGGIFLYGMLYNYMYSPDVLRDVPVVVIDESRTPLSRQYIRLLDATPQVQIQGIVDGIPQARHRVQKGEAAGIVFLPADFNEKVGRGEEAVFVSYNTSVAFLYYAALKEAFSGAMLALDDAIRPAQIVFLNTDVVASVTDTRSMGVQGIALYNESGGYASYLIPAVLMVIIFQTLMMVISMRCGTECEQGMKPLLSVVRHRSSWSTSFGIVVGKSIVYVSFYAFFSVFLIGLLPLMFDLPHLASPLLLIQLMIPYLFATAFFGLSCSPFFKDSDAPLLLIAFFSVGLLFLSGVSWPLELMPWPWRIFHCLIPAPVGILAYVKTNCMGASISDISKEMWLLWGQCVLYFGIACWVYKRSRICEPTQPHL